MQSTAATPGRFAAFCERRFTPIAAITGIAGGFLSLLVTKGSGFHSDDIWNLGQARDEGFTLDFLTHPVTEDHLAPGHRLIFALVNATGPDWTASMILTALIFAAMTFACAFAVRESSGSAVIAVIAAGLLATSVPYLRASIWLSSTAHELPATSLMLLSTWAALRWCATRRPTMLALSGSSFALGLLFFEKYLIISVPLLVLITLARPAEPTISWTAVRRQIRSALPLVALLAAITAADALVSALAATGGQGTASQAGSITAGQWRDLVVGWWQHGIGAMAINGNPVTAPGLLNAQPAVDHLSFLGLLALAALAALTIRGWRPALIWATALVTLLANGVFAGAGRVGIHGVDYVMDPRYHTTTLLTLILLVPAAWRASGSPLPARRSTKACLAAAGIAAAIVWSVNGAEAIRNWHEVPHQAAAYAANLNNSLTRVTRRHPGASLIDEPGPQRIAVPTWVSQWGSTGKLVVLLAPDAPIPVARADGPAVRVGQDGIARVVRARAPVALRPSQPLCGAAPTGSNLFAGSVPIALTVIPSDAFAPGSLLLATIHFRTTTSLGGIGVDAANGALPLSSRPLPDAATGLRQLLPPDVDRIRTLLWGGAAGCVTGVDVIPVAAPGG